MGKGNVKNDFVPTGSDKGEGAAARHREKHATLMKARKEMVAHTLGLSRKPMRHGFGRPMLAISGRACDNPRCKKPNCGGNKCRIERRKPMRKAPASAPTFALHPVGAPPTPLTKKQRQRQRRREAKVAATAAMDARAAAAITAATSRATSSAV